MTTALIVDGLDIIIRARVASRNQLVLSAFRADLAKNTQSSDPDVTIILPAYKNPEEVERCLHYLLKADVPRHRIIVVDDYSNDNFVTATTAANFGVKVISIGRNTRKVGAVNVGLHLVDTKYVIILDSDSIILSNYSSLGKVTEEMEVFGLDAMACRILPCPPASKVGRGLQSDKKNLLLDLQTLEFEQCMRVARGSMYGIKKLNDSYKLKYAEVIHISGAFGIFRTPIVSEVMDNVKEETVLGEDAERTLQILAKNGKVGYSSELLVLSACKMDVRSHYHQRVDWGDGFFRTYVSRFGASVLKRRLAGTTYLCMLVRDILLHPLKLVSIPLLFLYPLEFIFLLGFYVALNIFVTRTILADLKVSPRMLVLDIFYKLYMVVFPCTVGYYNATVREIRLHITRRNYKFPPIEIVKVWNLPIQPSMQRIYYQTYQVGIATLKR
jgi:cellulose synthase/poly-beta-1,6-N-acetylglucosamine synthase-like glycosyltransferase